jgi:hypothetical protein
MEISFHKNQKSNILMNYLNSSKCKYHSFLISLFVTSLFIFLTNITIGSYFEDSEKIISQFLNGNCSNPPFNNWKTDLDFMLFPIYSYLQYYLPSLPILSITRTLTLGFSIIIILTFSLKWIKNDTTLSILITALLLFVLLDHVININNVRISMLLSLAAYLVLFSSNSKESKHKYFSKTELLFLLLILGSIIQRLFVPFIISGICTCLTYLFRERRRFKMSLIGFSLSTLFVFPFYGFINHSKANESVKNFQKYERAIFDNNDAIIKNPFEVPNTLDSSQLIIVGKMLLMQDKDVITSDNYAQILNHETKIDYIFKNDQFLNDYGEKLSVLWNQLIQTHLSYLLTLLILSTYFAFLYKHTKHSYWIFIFIVCTYISVPCILSTFASVPSRFISPYLSFGVISTICAILINNKSKLKLKFIISVALIIGTLSSVNHFKNTAKKLKQQTTNYNSILECMLTDKMQSTFLPVFSHIAFNSIYDGKLFSSNKNQDCVYVEAYHFNFLGFMKTYKKQYFGDNYENILDRYTFISDNSIPFYSIPYYVSFIQNYLLKIHKTEFSFTLIDSCGNNDFNKYQVKKIISRKE